MVGLMRRLLCDDNLSARSRERLLHWLRASSTGKNRLRAGFPTDWLVGDKTGSGNRNAINDVAIAVPPGRAPVLVAAYTSGSGSDLSTLEAAHVSVARAVTREL
jgi:beta-lactamase class A